MKKLMIGEIQTRYDLFLNNTLTIKTTPLIFAIREEFQNHFGAADDYLQERIEDHKRKLNGKSYHDLERTKKYFKLDGFKAASINFGQQQNKPKNRSFFAELIEWDNHKQQQAMVPFIKFNCNPEGILILEKLWFESIV